MFNQAVFIGRAKVLYLSAANNWEPIVDLLRLGTTMRMSCPGFNQGPQEIHVGGFLTMPDSANVIAGDRTDTLKFG